MIGSIRVWFLCLAAVAAFGWTTSANAMSRTAGQASSAAADSVRQIGVAENYPLDEVKVTIEDASPATDSFNRCVIIDTLWNKSLPTGAALWATGYTADIMAGAGMTHDPDKGGNNVNQTPRLTQAAANTDFVIEARFLSTVDLDGQQQGLLFEQGADDFVSIAIGREGVALRLRAYSFDNGAAVPELNKLLTAGTPRYLRIARTGNQWQVTYSFDGFDYLSAGSFNHSLAVSQVSLFAGSSGAVQHTAVVDYLRNHSSEVNPADTVAMTLDRVIAGLDPVDPPDVGTVTGGPLTPTPGNPACGTPMNLIASPSPGWAFDRWEGDFGMSEDPSLIREFGFGERVTAYFMQETYRLQTQVQSNGVGNSGAVEITPEKVRYLYNDNVVVQAKPDPGWQFSGWIGDLPGANATETITMTKDMSVTATFSQTKFSVSVAVIGGDGIDASANSIDLSAPTINPPGYVYSETTTITARPVSGWIFTGWSGDLDGTELTETLVLTSDATITATFAFERYQVLTETVDLSGELLPDAEIKLTLPNDGFGYVLGEQISAEAFPPDGWRFVRWEGALDSTANPASFSVTATTTLRAVFESSVGPFRLFIDIKGQGTVIRRPEKAEYEPNEMVTLIAEAEPDWLFKRWEDDVPRGNLSKTEIPITMDGNKTVTAIFDKSTSASELYLPLIVRD